ncbi:MAG: tRNA (adenosine(37)-N6)-threonylcarbamoyltransferase complex ATPase subunit type 1 TsaE [Treponema sp.]|nr:tRNA (adenosine(37)-N6)-threonylcarbamoyltransferase complex ATPase subunit type 1 TsaE [Treponema sp.]
MTSWSQEERSLIEIVSSSPEETASLGERVAGRLHRGSVIALRGGLGSGKTCFAKGIARGLGIGENITSPTYTIVCEYPAPVPLYHIDAYRLTGDEDFENTGAAELLGGEGIAVIEWSERIPRSLPPGALSVSIEITGAESRVIRISGAAQTLKEIEEDFVL